MGYLKNLAAAGGDMMRVALAPLYQRLAGEAGTRVPADVAMQRWYRQFAVSTEVREKILLLREMEMRDGRVKSIHGRLCRDVIRGGLVMQFLEQGSSETLRKEWLAFSARLQLNRAPKLRSDARGLVVEGNLPLQLVFDERNAVVAAVRMPAETMVPLVDASGRFSNPAKAYEQRDTLTGQAVASFGAWQLHMARHDPLNHDDLGEMGRPFLDATVETWRKLVMTEEDLVIRRRQRAPLRLSHVLEGATNDELDTYRKQVEGEKGEITTDFYANRKGAVTAVQGDANLEHIADVVHLLDSFFAGTSAPKALFGYTDGLSRDLLADLKRDYYDEIDHLQDEHAGVYDFAFRLHLLMKGIVTGPDEFTLRFAERRTESPNEVADLALKLQALGLPPPLVWAEMGYDPASILDQVEAWRKTMDPYPMDGTAGVGAAWATGTAPAGTPAAKVSVTPGNAPRSGSGGGGGSATSIGVPGTNHGRGR